jgi:VWFA-related protein
VRGRQEAAALYKPAVLADFLRIGVLQIAFVLIDVLLIGVSGRIACAQTEAGHAVTTTVLARDAEGRPLTGLKEQDFNITEKGQERAISGLKRLGASKGFITNRPPDGYVVSNRPLAAFFFPQPVTILLLDTADTDPEFQRWMQAQCLRFFTMMRPTENAAVYQLQQSGLRLLHEFSNAPAAMGDEISQGGLARGTDRFVLKPDRIVPMDEGSAQELEQEAGDPALRAQRYRRTCVAITGMALYLHQFAGRKDLLWMSADFPPFGDNTSKDQDLTGGACQQMLFALAAADVAVYPVDVRSEVAVEPFAQVLPGHLEALPEKRRKAISPALVSSMVTLAAVTGGKPIANRSQLAEVMTDAVDASRSAYAVTFQVPEPSWDGKIHVMQVTANRRNVEVTAKRLYFAGTMAGNPGATFDAPAIGISVTAAPNSDGTRMSVFLADRDLTWIRAGDGWRATVQMTTGTEIPVVKSFDISNAAHENLQQGSVSIETETRSKILVRDMASGKTGSVTLPVNNPKK